MVKWEGIPYVVDFGHDQVRQPQIVSLFINSFKPVITVIQCVDIETVPGEGYRFVGRVEGSA